MNYKKNTTLPPSVISCLLITLHLEFNQTKLYYKMQSRVMSDTVTEGDISLYKEIV